VISSIGEKPEEVWFDGVVCDEEDCSAEFSMSIVEGEVWLDGILVACCRWWSSS